ncbi:M23 family metallopeptidase [Spirosoma sp. SC4-14]|uniref:M23 family metallopeptidase n=1 Tax=Spirosoma sp. SC4-14 TaxID=3128900 RepID=UPI0030CC6F81
MEIKLKFRLPYMALAVALLEACQGIGPATNLFRPTSPHDQYGQSLRTAKLDQTALGADWLAAGERALQDSLTISIPYRERGYFPAAKPFAVGYRMSAQRGDRFLVQVETQGKKQTQVFIDVYALDDRNRASLLAASKADTNVLAWEPRRTQTCLIRIQPELLRSGSYTISITREPALSFPVKGRDSRQISSFFGASRDAGRRRHEGVDIFAPRGTPAVASVDGVITGVTTNSLGGNVVFLSDNDRAIRLYYAHLDRWNVNTGQRVTIGDTVGFIGNTGNARTTGPHLHFGIYGFNEGAIDPLPFIRLGRGPARQTLLPESKLGDSVRISTNRAFVRVAPGSDGPILRELPNATALTVVGGTAAWLRVELPNGQMGYVASSSTESMKRPLHRVTLSTSTKLFDAADQRAAVVKTLMPGSDVNVLAKFSDFQFVRSLDGQFGWLSVATAP